MSSRFTVRPHLYMNAAAPLYETVVHHAHGNTSALCRGHGGRAGLLGLLRACTLPALVAANNPYLNAANPEHRAANSTSAAAIGSSLALASRIEIEAPRMAPHCALARDVLLSGARTAVGTLLVVGDGLAEKILLLSARRLRAQSRRLRLGRLPDRRRLGVFQDNATDQILTSSCTSCRIMGDTASFLVLTHGLSESGQKELCKSGLTVLDTSSADMRQYYRPSYKGNETRSLSNISSPKPSGA